MTAPARGPLGRRGFGSRSVPSRRRRPAAAAAPVAGRAAGDGEIAAAVGADLRVPRRLDIVARARTRGSWRSATRRPIRRSRRRPPTRVAEAYIAAEPGIQVQGLERGGRASSPTASPNSARRLEASERALQEFKEQQRRGLDRRRQLEHRDPAADRSERRADQGQDRTDQQGSALQPAEVGAGSRRDRYASGGSDERIRPGAEDQPRRCPARSRRSSRSGTASVTPR